MKDERKRLSPLQLHETRMNEEEDEETNEPEDVTAFTFSGHVIKVRV